MPLAFASCDQDGTVVDRFGAGPFDAGPFDDLARLTSLTGLGTVLPG